MIARCAIALLERPLVLLVDDNQPEVIDGGEDAGTRAYDDAIASSFDLVPLIKALSDGETGVLQRDLAGKSGSESLQCLGRHGNFGNHDDCSLSRFDAFFDRSKVYLGLAAAGHAEEKELAVAIHPIRIVDTAGN